MTHLIELHLDHLRAAGRSEETIADRKRCLLALDAQLPYGLHRVAAEELIAWLGRPGWSAQTRATYWGHARVYYRWLTETGWLDFDPMARIPRPRVRRGLPHPATDAQVADILARGSSRLRAAVILAAYAGYRCAEMAAVDRADLERDPLRITGKGDRTRIVPRHPLIAELAGRLPAGPVLRRRGGGRFDPGLLSQTLRRELDRLDHPGLTPHAFRHAFATNLLRGGADLRTVQELMGHSSPVVTAVYTAISDGQRRNAVAALPVLAAAC